MSLVNFDRFRESINSDPEFLLSSKFWNASIKFEIEDDHYILKIQDGKIVEVNSEPTIFDAWDFKISGPLDGWKNLFAPVPQPFYQDLMGAILHHGFSYEGDIESMFAYWGAMMRMIVIMRDSASV